ncbi:MAG: hypothetical protein KRP56_03050 [Candidatus Methanogranum gryphiswaldense]|nr:MAG: hypothetical protein KRP56_03050 [Candidatus Methanogranum sp. U3.2.1]
MTEYFTNPKDKFFFEKVNPLRYTQSYNGSFTPDGKIIRLRPMLVHVRSDDSYFWAPCEGCGKEGRDLKRIVKANGSRIQYLCSECRIKGRGNQ